MLAAHLVGSITNLGGPSCRVASKTIATHIGVERGLLARMV